MDSRLFRAIIAALGLPHLSPEARHAAAGFSALGDDVGPLIREGTSGRELIEAGYEADVDIAAAVDTSRTVPVLRGDGFLAPAADRSHQPA